jgi:hypothetical protein
MRRHDFQRYIYALTTDISNRGREVAAHLPTAARLPSSARAITYVVRASEQLVAVAALSGGGRS